MSYAGRLLLGKVKRLFGVQRTATTCLGASSGSVTVTANKQCTRSVDAMQCPAAAAAAAAARRSENVHCISGRRRRRTDVMSADILSGVDSSLGRRWRRDHHHHHHHRHRYQQDEELIEFAQTTSLHGVPRVISARSLVARVFWSTVCLGAFLMFLANSASLLHQYRSYPKKVHRCVIALILSASSLLSEIVQCSLSCPILHVIRSEALPRETVIALYYFADFVNFVL